ncbi:MAG: hypothetical protein QN141_10525 [Armatimonadota bacterium]|nr:hypothetical protein [Armatimonadota bacterium]MDR7451518.1 hypothetical protein [Armatimonadota bacterium]MDR7467485.1 hypothetical protein [Armatimonadota bacterium]MDR7494359.1 hypothetical protein [Armatimonadota bacterium]MDR7499176.1 hypothetical protein [Armatimonadota bacterium]
MVRVPTTWRRRWWLLIPFVGGTVLTAVLVAASAAMLSPETRRSPRRVEVVIPPGTA